MTTDPTTASPNSRPAILTVDDETEVLRAIERDLKGRYADRYRVLRADSGKAALAALEELQRRGEPLALLLSDHRMPEMDGVELLRRSLELYPDARRVLLTAYADTDAAIRAINDVKIDYYLLKPWSPPEDKLFPILDDLLTDWQANFRPPLGGLRVLGLRWSAEAHRLKDFLARNQAPYSWLDIEARESNPEIDRLVKALGDEECLNRLPIVVFPDGTSLSNPEMTEVAAKLGLRTQAERPFYDLVIIGAGPAGLAAAVYGGSEGLKTVLIEREAPGGQAGTSSRIENYLGFPNGVSGADLARRAVTQARKFNVEILAPQNVCAVRVEGPYRVVKFTDGTEISCHALLIATGVSWRRLKVPGVENLTGRGVYYGAAMTEAMSCEDDDLYVIGGANSAGQGAMHFARYAHKVIMLVRADDLRKGMSDYLVDQIEATPNIEVRLQTEIVAVEGEERLECITFRDNSKGGAEETRPATALFIFIGAEPKTEWLADVVERDKDGFVMVGLDLVRNGKRPKGWPLDRDPLMLETSVPGIFVAGDVRHGSVKRVAAGVGEGGVAVSSIHRYLSSVR